MSRERNIRIEINATKAEISKQENLISAHTARIGSILYAELQIAAAKKFVEEKIPDINKAIQEAIHRGERYATVTFRCNDGQTVGEELRAFLEKSGYIIPYCVEFDRVVKIGWRW